MCGGDAEAFDRVQPVLQAYARAAVRIGPSGTGQLAKMVNQLCIAGLLQSLAEGIHFGERAGLDMQRVLEVIGTGAAQSWQMHHRGPTMIEGRFDFGFAVEWMRKDLGISKRAAAERARSSEGPASRLTLSGWLRCGATGFRGPRCVEPSM